MEKASNTRRKIDYKGALAVKDYTLEQNFPNPFNPSTVINYQLVGVSSVKLMVYDILGREIATLVNGMKSAGYYSATFDASRLASGIYFARIIATPQDGSASYAKTMKMLLMK
jgi:Secretion system C-terminal sorting domain